MATPAVYRVEVGWGDCMAGCMFRHQTFVEVRQQPSGSYVTSILAETGEPLSSK